MKMHPTRGPGVVALLAAAGVVLIAASPSEAALCKRGNGTLIVRSECRGKLVPATAADLGVLGVGLKGDKGDLGAKGDKGDPGAKGDQGQPGSAATTSRVVKDANGVAVGTVISEAQSPDSTLPFGFWIVRGIGGLEALMFLPNEFSIEGACAFSPCDALWYESLDCSGPAFITQPSDNFYPNSVRVGTALIYPNGPGVRPNLRSFSDLGQCTVGGFPADADVFPTASLDLSQFVPPFQVVQEP